MRKLLKPLIIVVVVLTLAVAAYIRETGSVSKTGFALDTVITVSANGKNAKAAVDAAMRRITEIEKRITAYSPDSDLATGVLTNDAKKVIARGIYFGYASNGLFDITIKPVIDLWGINTDTPRVPSDDEIQEALALVDYHKIAIMQDKLILPQGMAIDLGGIGKGYAADEAAQVLRDSGIKDAVIDLGGNIVVLGTKKIGIQNPSSGVTGDYMGTIKVTDRAVVTSGSYERNFTQDGNLYHHIFDPLSGKPADSGLVSVTVIGENAQDADAISTIIFIMGASEGLAFAEKMGVEAMVIDSRSMVMTTGGFGLTITNTAFQEV